MKNRNCPNKDMCWDYNASRCEGCAVGEKIARLVRENKKLKTENAELRARLEKAVELPCKIGDTTNLIVENEVLQRDVDNLARTLEEGTEEFQEVQHRAEVAERALLTACVNLIKDEKDNVNMELLARVVYTKFLRKAEKELEVVQ